MQNSRDFQEIKRTQDSQQRRKIQEISRDYLRNATYRYLERYATSEANLRKVLLNKVARRTREVPVSPETMQEISCWIDEIIATCRKMGMVDDRFYAESRARTLIRRGNSRLKIFQKLRAKGLSIALIEEVLADLQEEMADPELVAAIKYVRRRRFGPFSGVQTDEQQTQKQMAAMARAGFSYDMAQKVLGASRETLEDLLYASSAMGPSS
ncbi:regulatory protein RecX [Luteithermobacter gelatinilyticus]|uniref:regulatory protein RecX n=1 Tax=Luteithermobacter gelatinilyticus TaxID=2582913 RepID=UPI001105F5C8|nr:RecX family transcriptional regulator [Luteithermobacter gelatinilyticus]